MYVIFGATGKVGGATALELRRRGLPVRALVRDTAKAHTLADAGCEIAVADLHDAGAIAEAIKGCAGVLVLSPINPTGADIAADAARITDNLAIAIARAQPAHVVPLSDYGAHHATGTGVALLFHRLEERLRQLPVATTFLRSAEHMENWTRILRAAPSSGVFRHFHQPLTKILPIVWSADVGVVAADLLTEGPAQPGTSRVVHVEGPRRYAVAELVSAAEELAGTPIAPLAVPQDQWVAALTAGRGLSESHARLIAEMYAAHNAGLIDVEPGGAVRRGSTTLAEGFGALLSPQVATVPRLQGRY
jgi:NAD(P)H dehydrogenase (quinone)